MLVACIKWFVLGDQISPGASKGFDCGVSSAMNSWPAKAGKHQIRGWKVSADHLFFVPKAD